jgi:hypothetical protein
MYQQTLQLPDIERLIEDIEAEGFARIPGFVSREELSRAQDAVRQRISGNGGESVMVAGEEPTASVLPAMKRAEQIGRDICSRVAIASVEPQSSHPVIRCLGGRSIGAHSLLFHYDSNVVTALIPVIIPAQGRTGDLILLPNRRPLRSHYARNLVDKFTVDNPLSQWLLRRLYTRRSSRLRRLRLAPGDLYLFWGYRSLHTNEAVDEGEVRSTAIVHCGYVHRNSRLRRMLGRQA